MATIGIFDSGIGGLTLASEVKRKLAEHSIIYFGDTAHFPYGEKSTTAIQSYSIKICNLLLDKGCDIILIACNSASASAYELVKEYVGSKAKVFNVIDAAVDYIATKYSEQEIGLIGTKRTISSNVYLSKIDATHKNITLHSLATPLLAPMIEEGFYKKAISEQIISEYLSYSNFEKIKAIILGCTHYPLIKNAVINFFNCEVEVIDSPEIVVKAIQNYLLESNLDVTKQVEQRFFVSDYTESFKASTSIFFGEQIDLQEYKMWE